jgi:hypothetical protein
MDIRRPNPEPRDNGDYATYTNGVAYGRPYGSIKLDEAGHLRLDNIALDDARRLAKAAVQVEQELTAAHARMTAPHGGEYLYRGTCQLCGKPEGGELHAEPAPLCRACENEPATEGDFCEACAPAAILAGAIASGTPVKPVTA